MGDVIDFGARKRSKASPRSGRDTPILDGTIEVNHEEFLVIEQVFTLVASLEMESSKAGRRQEAAVHKAIADTLWEVVDKGRKRWPPKGYA